MDNLENEIAIKLSVKLLRDYSSLAEALRFLAHEAKNKPYPYCYAQIVYELDNSCKLNLNYNSETKTYRLGLYLLEYVLTLDDYFYIGVGYVKLESGELFVEIDDKLPTWKLKLLDAYFNPI